MQKFLHILALTIVGTVAFCMLYLQVFPILHDYPEWMYQGWIFAELLGGDNAEVAGRFQLVTYPVPNSISQVAIGLLNFVVSPVMAGKLWLAFYFALSAWLWWVMSRHPSSRFDGALHLLLTDLITFGPGFWNGYINFQFGLLFFALYLYLTIWRGVRNGWVLAAFSILIFFSHAIAFGVFVVFNLICLLTLWRKQLRNGVLVLIPSLVLTAWYAIVKLHESGATDDRGFTPLQWLQYKAYTVAKQGPFHNFIGHDGKSTLEDLPVVYQVGFALNFLVALLLIGWVCWLGLKAVQRQPQLHYRFSAVSMADKYLLPLFITIAAAVVAFLLGSQNSFGVVNIGERFLIFALLILLVLFKCPGLIRRSLVLVCAVLSFYTLGVVIAVSKDSLEIYAVERSSEINDLQQYLGDIYANTRHKHFNHRLFIYADRGVELTHETPVLLAIDLPTSVVVNRK